MATAGPSDPFSHTPGFYGGPSYPFPQPWQAPWPQSYPMHPNMMMGPAPPQWLPEPQAAAANKRTSSFLSSSSTEDAPPVHYTPISEFLTTLSIANEGLNSSRRIERYIPYFQWANIYTVADVADLDTATLMGDGFSMSLGNAMFLLKAVKKEKTRVEKAAGKKRRID